ncbi:EpsG family protein [Sulfurovum sp. XTW-4]|uniref:EpsG family protein n=1 Tax=Sulfurovum xiamenensis TaxID=3019066 RepID=A0ABT7QNI8_9BACT|nr:EpsG family protein [Sulfurovum xiamenensis]MDM5262629.1 EpsG family protein [Sulfurovum xiamenensis]
MHYLLIPYALFMLLTLTFLSDRRNNVGRSGTVFVLLLSLILLGVVITVQPFAGDSYRYAMGFLKFREFSLDEVFKYQTGEYLFRFLNWIVGQFTDSPHILFLVIYLIAILTFYKALKNIFPTFERYVVFSFYVLYPYFLFYIVNGKRQGLGLVFMVLAISYLMEDKNRKALLSLLVSGLIHSGMFLVLPMAALFVLFKEKGLLKISFVILAGSVLLSISGINDTISGPLGDLLASETRYSAYLDERFEAISYQTGFRLDFALFSFFPIFLYALLRKRIRNEHKTIVRRWLAIYMLLNSIYHIFSFVPFNDRFAIFSWFILPIVSYIIVSAVNKRYAALFIFVLLGLNVFFLQTYTGRIFQSLEIF